MRRGEVFHRFLRRAQAHLRQRIIRRERGQLGKGRDCIVLFARRHLRHAQQIERFRLIGVGAGRLVCDGKRFLRIILLQMMLCEQCARLDGGGMRAGGFIHPFQVRFLVFDVGFHRGDGEHRLHMILVFGQDTVEPLARRARILVLNVELGHVHCRREIPRIHRQ